MFPHSVWAWGLAMVCAYLLGSFSTSITVSKLFYHQDIRQMGSGNAGATNTLRNFGAYKALLVVLGVILRSVLRSSRRRYGRSAAGRRSSSGYRGRRR